MSIHQFYKAGRIFGRSGFTRIIISRILNRITKLLDRSVIRNYEITYALLKRGNSIRVEGSVIKLMYEINHRPYEFSLLKKGSDLQVFDQLILNKEYLSAIRIINNAGILPESMIDAGANIGLASLYFKAFYPQLDILAIEPSLQIYNRLDNHIRINKIDKVSAINGAVWRDNGKLRIENSFRDGLDWSTRTVKSAEGDLAVDAYDIPTLMAHLNVQVLDILKMDIEGAESDVFLNEETVQNWLPFVKCLIVEIHDEFDCRERIMDILSACKFTTHESKEYTIAINTPLVAGRG